MSDQPKKRWSLIKVMMTVVIVLVLYVLSIGPAAWIQYNSVPTRFETIYSKTIVFVYTPVIWLSHQSEFLWNLYRWYLGLW